jgi:MFS family permease
MARIGKIAISKNYGWIIVFVTFVMTALCFGGLTLVAVFIKPLAQEFGWQRGEIATAYTIAAATTAAFGVLFGRVADLRGARTLALLGAVMMGACLLLLSQIAALWQIYVLFALFGAFGHAPLYVPLTALVARWFKINQGLAVGIASVGSALGLALVPFIASAIMVDLGWRDALVYLGFGYLALALPLVVLVRNPPATSDAPPNAISGISTDEGPTQIRPGEAFAWVCSAAIFCCICMAVPMIHVPSLVSDLGIDAKRATSVLTVTMLAGAAGRVVFGRVMDRVGPLLAYMLASLGQTVFVFWFVQMPSLASLYLIAVGFGLCFGGVMISLMMTMRSLVPVRMSSMAMAIAALFGWIGMGLGGSFGGLLFDWSGTYVASFGGAALAGLVNLAILSMLFVRLRRVTRLRFTMGHA